MSLCLQMYLFDEGDGNQVPRHNAMVHELQEGCEGEGQHFTKAEGITEQRVISSQHGLYRKLLSALMTFCILYMKHCQKQQQFSLCATFCKSCQCPYAFHINELCGKGWICRQLGQLLQGLQPSVDAVGLNPLQELTRSTALSARKKKKKVKELKMILMVKKLIY